ncbi:MAG: outer membrane protein assembly factor BamB family protein, partial [Planctomycetota bacterium]
MTRAHSIVFVLGSIFVLASGGPATAEDVAPAFPAIVGDGVGPQNHAHWPVRVQFLEQVRWTYSEGSHVGMAAPIADGLLFVQAGGGSIRGVEAGTGKRWWISPGHTTYWNYSTCVLGPGGIAYGGNYDFVQAVDRQGKRLWRTQLQCRWIHSAPAVSPDGTTLYVSGDGLGIAALNTQNGLVNWMRRDFASPWNTYCFDAAGNLIVSTRAGTFCFAPNGKELWSLPGKLGHLMVVEDTLISTDERGVHGLDLATRERVWTWPAGQDVVGLAYGDDERILVSLLSGELASLSRDGRLRWLRRLSETALHRPVTVLGGETLVADVAGRLMLCDSNGRVISFIETNGQPYRWRPTVSREGMVYLGHRDHLFCIGGARRSPPRRVVASDLAVVADDFVVDV